MPHIGICKQACKDVFLQHPPPKNGIVAAEHITTKTTTVWVDLSHELNICSFYMELHAFLVIHAMSYWFQKSIAMVMCLIVNYKQWATGHLWSCYNDDCFLLGSFFPALKPPETVFKVIFWLGYFNSCINPIIYPCFSKEFQRAFIRLLRCQCRKQRLLHRFYDQRWRTAVKGRMKDKKRHCGANYTVHKSLDDSLHCKGQDHWLHVKRWNMLPLLQKSPFQLKEKETNMSNKIKGGTEKNITPGHIDIVDTVSMEIYKCDQSGYKFYDLTDCYSLKETDI